MKAILVTSYIDPDLDGTAGAVGYAEFLQKTGRDATPGTIGKLHEESLYVLDRFKIPYPEFIPSSDFFDAIILVDASELIGLEGKIPPEKVIEIIDHRKINDADKFPNAKIQIELVGAAATLIAEKFMHNNISISRESATLIYAAILSNTLNFKSTTTTDRDRVAATWLNLTARLPENFWRELFLAKSNLSGSKLAQRIEGDFAWFIVGDRRVGIAQIEIIGAQKLISERTQEIIEVLEKLKTAQNLDMIFQNTIDLEEGRNYIIANDETTQKLLEKILNVRFSGVVAERQDLVMRKQIVPLLKAALE